ncbi:unnamed protein product, partial [Prorocentrum cordatum]
RCQRRATTWHVRRRRGRPAAGPAEVDRRHRQVARDLGAHGPRQAAERALRGLQAQEAEGAAGPLLAGPAGHGPALPGRAPLGGLDQPGGLRGDAGDVLRRPEGGEMRTSPSATPCHGGSPTRRAFWPRAPAARRVPGAVLEHEFLRRAELPPGPGRGRQRGLRFRHPERPVVRVPDVLAASDLPAGGRAARAAGLRVLEGEHRAQGDRGFPNRPQVGRDPALGEGFGQEVSEGGSRRAAPAHVFQGGAG